MKDESEIEKEPIDYRNLWEIKPLEFNDTNWYLKNEVASEALQELKEESSSSISVKPVHQEV